MSFTRGRPILALLLLIAAGGVQAQQAPDVPAGDGAIRGQVIDAETRAPLADVEIALYALTAEGVPGLRRGTSDAEGRFAFEGIARTPNLAYLVGARHQGVPFPGARVVFEPGVSEKQVEVEISGLTGDRSQIVAGRAELRLQRLADGARIVETLRIENRGSRTFYVAPDARGGSTPALRAQLPEGFSEFEMPLGVVPEGVEREGRELAWWGPVHPGAQDLSFSYHVETEDPEALRVAWTLPEGASAVRLWVPSGARLESPGFSPAELSEGSGPGFSLFEAGAVPKGRTLQVALALPPARLAPGATHPLEVRAIVTVDDAALAVTETHVLQIRGEERVLGTQEQPIHRILLPPDVDRLRFGANAPGTSLLPDGAGGLLVLGEAAPGELRIEIAYRLATEGFPTTFSRRFDSAVPLASIFVADTGNLRPASDRLHRRRPVRTADLTYLHFEAYQIGAGETLSLVLDRQPPRLQAPPWLHRGAVGVAGLLALALLIAPLWSARGGGDLVSQSEPPAERERAAVVAALRDLEHDFETGKIEPGDYQTIRTELRGQALALMREARDGPAPEESPAAQVAQAAPSPDVARFCTDCGSRAEPQHRFCAGCGKALADASGPEEGLG